MGFRTSSIATRDLSASALAEALGFAPTGATDDFVDLGVYALALASGYALVVASGSEHFDALGEGAALKLSHGRTVLFLTQNETTMCNALVCYHDGALRYRVEYLGFDGPSQPSVEGAPPDAYASILAAALAQQGESPDGPDYVYDVVLRLAEALTGYRDDQTPAVREPIAVLARA